MNIKEARLQFILAVNSPTEQTEPAIPKITVQGFGCKQDKVEGLVGQLIEVFGVKAEIKRKDEKPFPIFQVFVPVDEQGSHNYTIGEPFMALHPYEVGDGSIVGIRQNGTCGNVILQTSTRKATTEEIISFCDKLPEVFHF